MSASPSAPGPRLGLRERKKIKTRLAIQEHALRLIREQGYENTTVEQIAEAAEISPSTFFRYFPAKDAVVLTDDYDPLLVDAFRAQPPGVSVVHALRLAYREVFQDLTPAEAQTFFQRAELILQVPELRASFLDSLAEGVAVITEVITERSGRAGDDPEVRAVAGAVMGVAITEFLHWARHPDTDFAAAIDRAMEIIEPAFPW
ncbi:MAG TPA: TetR family transcriptional regulator [Kineosporiaceae bacterium]|nr:TetR family transcriptional regulator [Kineosporiaceae bacterium]